MPDPQTDGPDPEASRGAAREDEPGAPRGASSDDPQGPPPPARVDLARAALAQARIASRRLGKVPGSPAEGRRGGRSSRTLSRSGEAAHSGAGPDDRDPQPLDRLVGRLRSERGGEAAAAVGGVMGRGEEIGGPEGAAHCRPERYADGELVVATDSSAWATQVRLLAPALVRRLNEDLGRGTVRRVRVLGPAAPSWRRGPRSVRGRGPRDTYG